MANRKRIVLSSSPEFNKLVKEIKFEQQMKKKKTISDRRITKAIARIPGLKDTINLLGLKDDED